MRFAKIEEIFVVGHAKSDPIERWGKPMGEGCLSACFVSAAGMLEAKNDVSWLWVKLWRTMG
jgi:hypothetical protein